MMPPNPAQVLAAVQETERASAAVRALRRVLPTSVRNAARAHVARAEAHHGASGRHTLESSHLPAIVQVPRVGMRSHGDQVRVILLITFSFKVFNNFLFAHNLTVRMIRGVLIRIISD